MFSFSGTVKFYYCPTPVSMRKSFDGLAGAVEELIHQNPESGHAFLFFRRTRKMMKLLQWDGDGFLLLFRRLIWLVPSAEIPLPMQADLAAEAIKTFEITSRIKTPPRLFR